MLNAENQKDEINVTEENKQLIIDMLTIIGGEDPNSEHLKDTPARVIKSWNKLYGGYYQNPAEVLGTVFEDGVGVDQGMVVLKDIEFYSTCIHHLLPFFGKVHIGYIPNGKVVGISKLARLVEVYSRRLQIQEKMTNEIADAMQNILKPKGVIVIVEAQHLCMVARGVEKQNSVMITSRVTGAFDTPNTKNEFLSLIGKR